MWARPCGCLGCVLLGAPKSSSCFHFSLPVAVVKPIAEFLLTVHIRRGYAGTKSDLGTGGCQEEGGESPTCSLPRSHWWRRDDRRCVGRSEPSEGVEVGACLFARPAYALSHLSARMLELLVVGRRLPRGGSDSEEVDVQMLSAQAFPRPLSHFVLFLTSRHPTQSTCTLRQPATSRRTRFQTRVYIDPRKARHFRCDWFA